MVLLLTRPNDFLVFTIQKEPIKHLFRVMTLQVWGLEGEKGKILGFKHLRPFVSIFCYDSGSLGWSWSLFYPIRLIPPVIPKLIGHIIPFRPFLSSHSCRVALSKSQKHNCENGAWKTIGR